MSSPCACSPAPPTSATSRRTSAVNEEFRIEFERVLAEQGTRIYRANVDEAFVAMRSALARLGMQLGDQAPRLGYLNVFAAAPKPLSADEWRAAAGKDLPKL